MSIVQKIQEMSLKFKELKATQFPIVKQMAIAELRKMAVDIEQLMQLNESAENTKRRRQIDDVLKKCKEIEKEIQAKTQNDIGGVRRYLNVKKSENHSYSQAELSKVVARSIVMKEIRSSQLKIKPEQVDQIVNKMHNNLEVMKQIQKMVQEQGNDLDRVDQYLEIAYENTQLANEELKEAAEIQKKTRMLKFRTAVTGFFGVLGYKIFGFSGMLMGFLFGVKSTS